MRCWRVPAGGVLVERLGSGARGYHHLANYRLVWSYWPRFGDDCELLYIFGYRVVEDRFGHCTVVELGYPYRQTVTPGELVFDRLVALPDDTVTDAELNAALGIGHLIESVYAVFDHCPRPERVAGFPHCRPPDADCALLRTPARLLDADVLDPYIVSAITTWGTAEDFRYFAPRVLELAVTEQITAVDLEIALGKLHLAGWRRWPPEQRDAVAALLDYYWTLSLAAYPGPRPIDEVLCALGNAVDDLQPLLDRWSTLATESAALHLRDFVRDAIAPARKSSRLSNAFWHRRSAQQEQVVRWLLSPDLRCRVEEAFYPAGGSVAEALDEAHRYLGP
jgi:hypothetical protein